MPTTLSVPDLNHDLRSCQEGSIVLDFVSRSDGDLLRVTDEASYSLSLRLDGGYAVYEANAPGTWNRLEAEDSRALTDGYRHSAVVTVTARGTRLYIDGYQVFCGTSTAFLASLEGDLTLRAGEEGGPRVLALDVLDHVLTSREVLSRAHVARPAVEFAANRLNVLDVARFTASRRGSIDLRFRVRGRMQEGTLLPRAAAGARACTCGSPRTGWSTGRWPPTDRPCGRSPPRGSGATASGTASPSPADTAPSTSTWTASARSTPPASSSSATSRPWTRSSSARTATACACPERSRAPGSTSRC